ncbi:SAM-dependent methyltransferase [Thermoactinospora rubra]|uniref:SAM-dependent methyltransferase n=1 Tax=Thermoactinospora rubra TaxID=1088767 RepID=UPI000A10976B|nr:SAM-dependent methyltransferase [Thermoactinospora rubra]
MVNSRADLAARIRSDVPHAARIWNYWMGGKDNFEADRAAGDAVASVYPDIVTMAVESRKFLIRVVRHLAAEAGVDQFLDIGTGLPTMQNTHEVAQGILPHARIVYVDNDPLVLVHARALLRNTTPQGVTTYVDGDYNEPEPIVEDAKNVLDFTRPIAVMFMGVLGYVEDIAAVRSIVSRVMDAVPSGSYLVLWDGTDTGEAVNEGSQKLAESGAAPYYLRTLDALGSCFDGLELVEPGLVPITRWRPDGEEGPWIDAHGAVARKP